ncbi:unnamed protein product [Vitrella brassicaformis CCMP3155]|uniref:Glucose-methanol-choline oxidoreductase N-terminal domain-containing protein n=1 Tax=Vitrella brassicaformis (strain CCMP3155) TaxID=1169540 RepID=A0A0G4H0Z7_VITBC|nr:unnamed protein product [Vitrella brassicaformis CCMP3155]|eukprot:CEM37164.1 unnamed protein product [Vitrella brassicaformis CCMP3155]
MGQPLYVFLALIWAILSRSALSQRSDRGKAHHKDLHKDEPRLYDYIVVGGGAAGAPLAATLAEDGDTDVLLLERGGYRSENWEGKIIAGLGIGLRNPEISQDLVTTENHITQLANVLSGGTALSAGVYIEENAQYFDALRAKGANFDQRIVDNAFEWVREQVATPMGFSEPYGSAWAEANEEVGFSPAVGPRAQAVEGSWNSLSLFLNDGDEMAPTRERLASDVLLSNQKGVRLEIKTRATVTRVEFDTSHKGKPQATCVQVVKSPRKPKPIDSRVNELLLEDIYDDKKGKEERHEVMRACIRPGGEIFLCAGAIFTPLLLMKSGVGPRDAVEKAMAARGEKGGLVLDIPELGQNLHDRSKTFIATFFDAPVPGPDGFKGTGAQMAGFKRFGDCHDKKKLDYNVLDTSLDCGWLNSEEFSGVRAVEGFLTCAQLILPPALRATPEADLLIRVLEECISSTMSSTMFNPLCLPLLPSLNCIKKAVGMVSFPTVPKTRGYVTINERGEPVVSGGYWGDPQGEDLNAAVQGMKHTLKILATGKFDDILQPGGPLSCPFLVLNSLMNLIMIGTRNLVPGSDEALDLAAVYRATKPDYPRIPSIWEFLGIQDRPDPKRALEEAPLTGLVKDKMQLMEKVRPDGLADWRGLQSQLANYLREDLQAAMAPIIPEKGKDESGHKDASHHPDCALWGPCTEKHLEEAQLRKANRYAIFPPLPLDMSKKGLETYIKAHGSSIWHWAGSAAMGTVTSSDFRVKGIENLSICDSSVFPQVPRMNPQATVMMLGRYAGMLRKEERKTQHHYHHHG